MGTNLSGSRTRARPDAQLTSIHGIAAFGIVVVTISVAACTGIVDDPGNPFEINTERMVQIGLTDIHQIYIDEPSVEDLAVAGLRGLKKIDPATRVENRAGVVKIQMSGGLVGSAKAPDAENVLAWAITVSKLVHDGRRASAKLRNADPEKIYSAVFAGVARNLDPYSRYASADEALKNRALRDGFGGIGVVVAPHSEGAEITEVVQGMPAHRAGLRRGERILAIDGQEIADMDLDHIARLLQGPVGRQVLLAVRRDDDTAPRELSIRRAHITPQTVLYRRDGKIAFIRITGFNAKTAESVEGAVERAQREIGGGIRGIVLDLRKNPGGLLHQAVRIADLFIEDGRIITTRGRHRDSLQLFDATPGDISGGLPIAVLVNGGSASAAEILAAALQDRRRAVLIGSTSYGKGTVQTVLRMPNDGELILTWARLYAPSGYRLSGAGVVPSVCTAQGRDAQKVIRRLLSDGGARWRRVKSIRRRYADAGEAGRAAVKKYCPQGLDQDNTLDAEVAKRLLSVQKRYLQVLKLASTEYAAR